MSIRVGLELAAAGSADVGGAWVLDLPGCFSPGADERGALEGIPGALRRYVQLLRRHGIAAPAEPAGPLAVVERFECFWGPAPDDRYEVNSIFSTDLGAVTPEEVAYAGAVLGATREELLRAAKHAGPAPAGDRSVDEMLHHVAGAEAFYVSRLEADPAPVRPFARDDEPDPRRRLRLVREWALERLAALPRLGALERTHRGERWTPRKVLRRFIYHELDHIRELEARMRVGVA